MLIPEALESMQLESTSYDQSRVSNSKNIRNNEYHMPATELRLIRINALILTTVLESTVTEEETERALLRRDAWTALRIPGSTGGLTFRCKQQQPATLYTIYKC